MVLWFHGSIATSSHALEPNPYLSIDEIQFDFSFFPTDGKFYITLFHINDFKVTFRLFEYNSLTDKSAK